MAFDDWARELERLGDVPGFAMAAKDKTGTVISRPGRETLSLLTQVAKGKFHYSMSVGHSSSGLGNQRPVGPDTVFALASASKLITTIAVLQAVDQGLLGLDDDVSPHVPVLANQTILTGFTWYGRPRTKTRCNPITLRMLLTQTAGAGYDFLDLYPLWWWRWWNWQAVSQGDYVEERFNHPLLHEPGDGWTYGSGITWAGKVLEAASGMTLDEWVQEYICLPLGISDVTFFPERHPGMLARVHGASYRRPWTGKVEPVPERRRRQAPEKDCMGGEGAYSTLPDLVAILHSLLVDDEKLLKKRTAAMMFTRQLSDEALMPMKECLHLPRWICQGLLVKDEYEWTIGGVMVNGDSHDCLKRGTLLWTGLFHVTWVSHFHVSLQLPPSMLVHSQLVVT